MYSLRSYGLSANAGAVNVTVVYFGPSHTPDRVDSCELADTETQAIETITSLKPPGSSRKALLHVDAPCLAFPAFDGESDATTQRVDEATWVSLEPGWYVIGETASGQMIEKADGGSDDSSTLGGKETEVVGTDPLRALGGTNWTDTDPTANSDVTRWVMVGNPDPTNYLYWAVADANDDSNEHVSVTDYPINPNGSTPVKVPAGCDLFLVRATAGAEATVHEVLS